MYSNHFSEIKKCLDLHTERLEKKNQVYMELEDVRLIDESNSIR